MTPIIATKTSSILLRILNWVADQDSNFRQAHKLRNTADERLADMGLTRKEANHAFFNKFGNGSQSPRPIVLRTGW